MLSSRQQLWDVFQFVQVVIDLRIFTGAGLPVDMMKAQALPHLRRTHLKLLSHHVSDGSSINVFTSKAYELVSDYATKILVYIEILY
ncbi:hypothetical protein NC653_032084 [Populus alba x Populus x berolinensis]|uniref:Uncharacterized protein n=1 Tax=Populus alba x Populus x berolinensis TaxID=444605 RepID=A0AAD6LR15_9ROSI|nr:hypothetical protein NC653_032084 [Populus alba x Populus x berolinensis]